MVENGEVLGRSSFGLSTLRNLSTGALKGAAVVVSEVLAPVNKLVDSRIDGDRRDRQQRDVDASLALGQAIVGRWTKGAELDPAAIDPKGIREIRRAAEVHGLLDFGLSRDQVTELLQHGIDDMLEPRPTLQETLQAASRIPLARGVADELPFPTS